MAGMCVCAHSRSQRPAPGIWHICAACCVSAHGTQRGLLDCSRRTAPGDKEAGRPEDSSRGLKLPPQAHGPLKMRALSKVSEEASSLERESSGRVESSTGQPVKGVIIDSYGREGTSKVLGGIHEQVDPCHLSSCKDP